MSGVTDQELANEYRPSMTLDVLHSWASEAAARLRGDGEQCTCPKGHAPTFDVIDKACPAHGEQGQAVAWASPEGMERLRTQDDSATVVPEAFRDSRHTIPLYDRPQPVAVAVAAVRTLPAKWRASIDAASPHRPQDLRPIRFVLDLEAALSTQPAPSEQVAARQINREFVEGVKQLCRDYSCRQNRPYMGDVFAQLDYLAEQLDMTVAPSEQVAASVAVPDGFVLVDKSDLLEEDSYGVYGSEFYRCKLCGSESGAGVLNEGIDHAEECPLAAAPVAPEREVRP